MDGEPSRFVKEIRLDDEAIYFVVVFVSTGAVPPVVWEDGKDLIFEYFTISTVIWHTDFKKGGKNFFKAFTALEMVFTSRVTEQGIA